MNTTNITDNQYDQKYANIMNTCKFKLKLMQLLKFFITKSFNNPDESNINILYDSHKNLFENDKLWYCEYYPRTRESHFTIHDLIHYLNRQTIKIYKRNSRRFNEYDVVELLIETMYNSYHIDIDNIFRNIYDYFNLNTNSNEKIYFIVELIHNLLLLIGGKYIDYIKLTFDDIIYILNICIDKGYDNNYKYHLKYLIDIVYNEIINHDTLKIEHLVEFITFYEKKVSIERIKKYEEDLIMKAWHPSRLINWCFDNEDKEDLGIDNL
jgi:hypothetical protein